MLIFLLAGIMGEQLMTLFDLTLLTESSNIVELNTLLISIAISLIQLSICGRIQLAHSKTGKCSYLIAPNFDWFQYYI